MALAASPLFQCMRSDAPPALMSRWSRRLPAAAARDAIMPGRSLRAVKLLPMNRTLRREGEGVLGTGGNHNRWSAGEERPPDLGPLPLKRVVPARPDLATK